MHTECIRTVQKPNSYELNCQMTLQYVAMVMGGLSQSQPHQTSTMTILEGFVQLSLGPVPVAFYDFDVWFIHYYISVCGLMITTWCTKLLPSTHDIGLRYQYNLKPVIQCVKPTTRSCTQGNIRSYFRSGEYCPGSRQLII